MTAVEAIRREFRELREPLEHHLLTNKCVDFADYRHTAGVLRGLALAEERILDLAKRMERDDE